MKNRYVGRTFIMPGQSLRKKSVRRKLNPMPMEFLNRNVLLVDDSLVRGTTSKEIIQMARDSGANKVYFASCAPPVRFVPRDIYQSSFNCLWMIIKTLVYLHRCWYRYPNVYGIDMPTSSELVASQRTEEEVAQEIGCDRLIFQDLGDLVECCRKFNPALTTFDVSVFNGEYVTGDVDAAYFAELETSRQDPVFQRTQPHQKMMHVDVARSPMDSLAPSPENLSPVKENQNEMMYQQQHQTESIGLFNLHQQANQRMSK